MGMANLKITSLDAMMYTFIVKQRRPLSTLAFETPTSPYSYLEMKFVRDSNFYFLFSQSLHFGSCSDPAARAMCTGVHLYGIKRS